MNRFEKDLKYLPVHIRTVDGGDCYEKEQLIYSFKDWQPPKELVKVRQFVADWFDINQDDIDGNIKALTRNIYRKLESEWSEMEGWFMYSPNKPIETLIRMKLDGYTVKKEQLYEVVFYVDEEDDRSLLMKTGKTILFEFESQNEGHYKQQFTESEIKAIDERYWPFAVPVDEV